MVRVLSCRFLRLSCSEDDHPLFRRYYARSNREKGVKLLRCFPHCCPEHVQRCYCGSSVHVLVTFQAELPVVDHQNLVVCARFEPSRVVPLWPVNLVDAPSNNNADDVGQEHERKLQPGEVVSLPETLLGANSREQTMWIRAVREGEAKQQTLPKNATLYVLNNHRFPKWFYSYDSSVTRTQREMTHHLVLYIFQLTGSRSQNGDVDALVLARQQSPAFKLISYRRSGNNSTDAGCDLPALDVVGDDFSAIDADSSELTAQLPSNAMEIDPTGSDREDALETKRGDAATLNQRRMGYAFRRESSVEMPDRAFWYYDGRARQFDLVEKAKHLIILWRFLHYVALPDAGISADLLQREVRPHWLRVAKCLRAPSDRINSQLFGVLSSFLLCLCRSSASFTTRQTPTRDTVVMQAAGHLLLRAVSSRAVLYAIESAFTAKGDTDGQSQPRERFMTLVLDLYEVLEDLLQLGQPTACAVFSGGRLNLPALVDEVLSLIYGQQRFNALRSEVSALLMGYQLQTNSHAEAVEILFDAFESQLREQMTAPERTGEADTNNRWSRRWLLDPGSFHISTSQEVSMEPSVVDLVRWLHEFVCVDIAVRTDGSLFSMRSVTHIGTGPSSLELVLDGRLRTFQATPSGSSTLIAAGGWSIGDYVASFGDAGALELDLYAFKPEESLSTQRSDGGANNFIDLNRVTRVRRLQMTFLLEQNAVVEGATANQLDLFVIFHGIVANSTYSARESRYGNQRTAQPTLLKMSTSERAVALKGLSWTAQVEIQGGYVAAPTPCGFRSERSGSDVNQTSRSNINQANFY